MKMKKLTPQKSRAQAMVEFAIALPILLMLLYGLLETGRLLFLYSTIVTASRQAVRYGSATGEGSVPGLARYRDCAGIREAANRVDFLNAFDHTGTDIIIRYDNGPGTGQTDYCPDLTPNTTFTPTNSSRIYVEIKGDFLPIIPRLVPFISRSESDIPPDPIKGISARTILVSVSIEVTNTPDLSPSTPTTPPTATSTSTATATDTATLTASPTLQFTYTPSETPTATLSPTATLTPAPTMTPTITNTPTITPSPTISPTPVAGCTSTNLKGGQISLSGSSMSLTITNLLTTPIEVKDIFVVWNHNNGHQGNKPLQLVAVAWEPPIWTGPASNGPSILIVPSPTTYAQPGTSTLTFTFDQAYDTWEKKNEDTPERILISFSTPGCTSLTIDVQHIP